MKTSPPCRSRPLRSSAFAALALLPVVVFAAALPGVVESRPTGSRALEITEIQDAQHPAGPPSTNLPYRPPIEVEDRSSPMEEQYLLQLLRQEVMELRGLVEELRFQLSRVKATQDDRYLELDSRLQQILTSKPTSPSASIPRGPIDTALIESVPGIPDETATFDEKSLYDTSLQFIRNRQYDLAINQLGSLIARFPDGEFTPNAYYWLGEVYVARPEPDYEKARQALAQVITFFPNHRKVPDAAFKLGKVYYLLGDCERAATLLNRVIGRNEGKSVAKLAAAYLRETVVCDS